jgi:hypothetical protein
MNKELRTKLDKLLESIVDNNKPTSLSTLPVKPTKVTLEDISLFQLLHAGIAKNVTEANNLMKRFISEFGNSIYWKGQ